MAKKTNGYYLFVSFDVVNSTMYKTKDPDWAQLFINIYQTVISQSEAAIKGLDLWKALGDELLFYIRIDSPKHLITVMTKLNDLLTKLNVTVAKMSGKESPYKLALKGTVFGGIVTSHLGSDKAKWKYLNIIVPNMSENKAMDFIGPDIDTGFRVAKETFKGTMVLDAKLACVLTNIWPEFEKYGRIVMFEQFKGVWDGKHYPIVWFNSNWAKFMTSFAYEDKFKSKIVMRLENNSEKFRNVGELGKIFKELNKTVEVQAIYKEIGYNKKTV